MKIQGRHGGSGKGPGHGGSGGGCLVFFVAFVLAAAGFFAVACGGKPPPVDCRVLGCDLGLVCEKVDDVYRCVPTPPCKLGECPEGQVCVNGKCEPKPPWKCELNMPGCHEVGQTCSTVEQPCWHNPTTNSKHCEEAPACESPPSGECTFGTPKASEAMNPEYKIQRQSRMIVTGTPIATFGEDYYCQLGLWPEACAKGRTRGPVAPDGHPQRLACEQQFNEQPCPTYSAVESNGHISFDPWFVIRGVNQNHPKNVAAGCNGEDWVKEGQYTQSGMWYVATVHGDTRVMGCIADGKVCGVSKFRVDN
ncbi:hypothetical protein LCGC14_1068650 [marine sediment metagenome]|uniref:Uncharacterized protein n=1 Tax=marine sediment metagenome TaxID=412755 RepID=A0A0F9N641_9ZZZZ